MPLSERRTAAQAGSSYSRFLPLLRRAAELVTVLHVRRLQGGGRAARRGLFGR